MTCQGKMMKGPFKTLLFCVCVFCTLQLICVKLAGVEVLAVLLPAGGGCRSPGNNCIKLSVLQKMFSCGTVSEGRSDKVQSFLCLCLVLLIGGSI